MPRRDQHVMLGLAVAMVAFAVVPPLTGVSPDLLLAAPVVMLLLPLLTGRYVGETPWWRSPCDRGRRGRAAPRARLCRRARLASSPAADG